MPIADDNSDRRTFPTVNIALILINVLVFVFFQELGTNEQFIRAWATVPSEIVTGKTEPQVLTDRETGQLRELPAVPKTPLAIYMTFLTSMFMHASIGHIFGNMLFLYIFGDIVETRWAIFATWPFI
jgi:membrane associated rhomboid family serine protease